MENLLKTLHNRIFVHYYSTLRGVMYGGLIIAVLAGKITWVEFSAVLGSLMALKAFIDKDPDKVQSKDQFKTN